MHVPGREGRESVLKQTAWRKGEEKLNYWGFSYGTVLGQTFAAMHPGRVNRLILDGVVDAEDYYTTNWAKNLQDTDMIGRKWSDYCSESGSDQRCPYYDEKMPPGYMHSKIGFLTRRFLDQPLVLPDIGQGPMVLDYSDIMNLMVDAFYEPFRASDRFFDVLGGLSRGPNMTRAAAWKANQVRSKPSLSPACEQDGPYSPACVAGQSALWSGLAIRCSDGADISNETKDEYKEYLNKLQRQSDAFGTSWGRVRLPCIGWKARPAWTFEGTSILHTCGL
jgi:pimeloyl-ACP methyl ester carboxylesterase